MAKQINSIMRTKLKGFGTGGGMSISEGDPELGLETSGGRASAVHPGLAPSNGAGPMRLIQAEQLSSVLGAPDP